MWPSEVWIIANILLSQKRNGKKISAAIFELENPSTCMGCGTFLYSFLVLTYSVIFIKMVCYGVARRKVQGGADKSLTRPGRKQATVTKLGIYSTYSPWSSIHFLVCCSDFCKPLKKNSERCPSNQVSTAAMTSTDEKWRPFNCFFSPRNRW